MDMRVHSLAQRDRQGLMAMCALGAPATGVASQGVAISRPRHTPMVRARLEKSCRIHLGLAPSWRSGLRVCTRRHGHDFSEFHCFRRLPLFPLFSTCCFFIPFSPSFSCCPQWSDTDIPVICAVKCAIVFSPLPHVGTSMTYRYTYMAWFFFYFLYIVFDPLRAKMILTTNSDPAIQSRSPLLAYFISFLHLHRRRTTSCFYSISILL